MVFLFLGLAVAIVVAFGLTVIVGFDEPVEEDAAPAAPSTANDVAVMSPLDGTAVPLSEVDDPVFGGGALGKGVAIRPRSGALYAPFDGTVVAAFPTGHAFGLRHADGTELLIHVGLDTVKLNGEHFTVAVTSGQEVRAGDLLVEFDTAAIEEAGFDLITPVIVTNGELYPEISGPAAGPVGHGDPLFTAVSVDSLVTTN